MRRLDFGFAGWIALIPLVQGCGSGLRSATSYSGRSAPELARPAQIETVRVLPAGYVRMGKVSAECRLTEGRRSLHRAWLSDVDCSQDRLVAALDERAASVGGDLLVGLDCDSRVEHESPHKQLLAWCRAVVSRPNDATLAARGVVRPEVTELTSGVPASAAWRIRVDYSPRDGAPRRAARRRDLVHDAPRLPVGHVPVGNVVASCRRGCSRAATREAVRITAGRMGGTDAVGVHCTRHARGWICAGVAATYAVPPALDPSAW